MSAHLDQIGRAEPKGPVVVSHDIEKSGFDGQNESRPDSLKAEAEEDTQHFQRGVRQARAITAVWTKQTLWMMFALFYLVSFVDILLVSVQGSLNPYITSEFGRHGLLAAVNVLPTILSGTGQLTLAKIIDLWGRIEGFMFMLLITILGNIIKATATSIQTYIAAHTLYWVGHIGLMFTIDVMLADMTTLKNRMLIFTVSYTPTIASTFAGPRVAELFYNNLNFRWAFGAFSFIVVGFCLPVIVVMLWSQRKAVKSGALVRVPSDRNWWQQIVHVYIQMDVTGIILITAAFAMFLLPFSLRSYAPHGWSEGYIIALLVLGVLFFPIFYAWERWLTPVPFLDWKYLQDMTILGSCFLYGLMFVSIFTWNAYFGSYLQVVHELSISNAGYVLNALSLTSSIFSPLFALIIRWTGNFKYTAYAGVPFLLLGTALLIPLRSPGTNIGLVAFTQILVGLGSGIFATCTPLAIMSPVTHQEIATVLAVQSLFGSIGASIGIAIAGAMWNNIMPGQLLARLPENITPETAMLIFGDITLQLGYEWGSPEREAIVDAYGNVQRKMAIVGACFVPLCLASIYFWRNINVKKLEEREGKQTRGTVW